MHSLGDQVDTGDLLEALVHSPKTCTTEVLRPAAGKDLSKRRGGRPCAVLRREGFTDPMVCHLNRLRSIRLVVECRNYRNRFRVAPVLSKPRRTFDQVPIRRKRRRNIPSWRFWQLSIPCISDARQASIGGYSRRKFPRPSLRPTRSGAQLVPAIVPRNPSASNCHHCSVPYQSKNDL